jgi:SAM-dependent methyltransferase
VHIAEEMPMDEPGFQLAEQAAERYERWVDTFMTPMAEALIDIAGVAPGQDVLDVACGTGFVTRLVAQRVGAEHVTGVDVNPGMLAVARRSCPEGITFTQAPADHLPFPDNSFDVLLCQQAAQFFPDRVAALAEFGRVLRPGGTMAVSVWSGQDDNPFLAAQEAGVRAALGAEVADAIVAATGGGSDRWLAAAADTAGLAEVTVQRSAREVTIPDAEVYLRDQVAATPWGAKVAAGGPEVQRVFVERGMAALRPHIGDDGTARVPFTANVLLARPADSPA